MAGRHIGVMCDGCSTSAFSGKRYKCTICDDYDLCELCQSSGVLTKDHARDHMMTEILPPGGNLVGAFGDIFGEFSSFSCPYCGIGGFNEGGLAEHCTNVHAGDSRPVVCPICAVRPGGDPSLISADFMGHLGMRHATSRFIPNNEDQSDEEESPFGGRGGRGGRGRGGRGRGVARGGRRALMDSDNDNPPRVFRASQADEQKAAAKNKLTSFSISTPTPSENSNAQLANTRLQQARFTQDLLFSSLLKPQEKPSAVNTQPAAAPAVNKAS